MENLMVFLGTFIIIFFAFLISYFIKKKNNILWNTKEIKMLTSRFKLNKKKLNYDSLGLIFVLVNSLIIAITGTLCTMLDLDYIWKALIGFVLIMALIYVSYGLIGKYLLRKEVKK